MTSNFPGEDHNLEEVLLFSDNVDVESVALAESLASEEDDVDHQDNIVTEDDNVNGDNEEDTMADNN